MIWIILALLGAFFTSMTTILAKIGIRNVNSNFATFVRTGVVIICSLINFIVSFVCWFIGGTTSDKLTLPRFLPIVKELKPNTKNYFIITRIIPTFFSCFFLTWIFVLEINLLWYQRFDHDFTEWYNQYRLLCKKISGLYTYRKDEIIWRKYI